MKNRKTRNEIAEFKVGRPSIFTKETLWKLEMAFVSGFSDQEACTVAGVGMSSLYEFQKKNPGFLEKKYALKSMITMKAKIIIAKSINDGCVKTAKWYLERKVREEFSLKCIHCQFRKKSADYYEHGAALNMVVEFTSE